MAESSPSSSKMAAAEEAAANELLATREILHGLKDALARRAAAHQDKISLTPTTRDGLLQESFPMIPTSSSNDNEDDVKVKADLTSEEYIALRIGLQSVTHSDVKRKMSLLQEQLSEYHAILEDVIAYKSKCQQLEHDKQDLTRICRETCKVRDDRIELLEKEVGRLRRLNEEQQLQLRVISSRNDSTSHDERKRSAQGGQPGPSQASYYEQEYQHYPDFNPQHYSNPPPPPRQPSPRTQSGMLTMMMSNSDHSSYHQPCTTMEPSRRLSLTSAVAAAVAATASHDDNNNMAMDPNCVATTTNFSTSSYGFDIGGAIQPLPFHNRRLPPSPSHHDDSSRYYRCNKKSRPSLNNPYNISGIKE